MADDPEPQQVQHPDPFIPPDLKSRLKESYDAIAPAYNAWMQQHNALRLRYLAKLLDLLALPPPTPTTPTPALAPAPTEDSPASANNDRPTRGRMISALELGCGAGVCP